MQGFWNGEVTEMGKRQIEALANRFSTIPVDAVYSSDLSRAVLTAEAVARWSGCGIHTSQMFRELNMGPWERCFFGNICHEQPELASRFLKDAETWRLEGAETFGEVRTRALAELRRIAEENDGKTVDVVSQGITTRCIMSGITGIPLSDGARLPIFKNTAVTRLIWNNGQFHVDYMNDSSHLPEDAQSNWSAVGDLRDVCFDPGRDREYYETCYADAWQAAHGSLYGYSPEPYYSAAVRHHRVRRGSVLRIYLGEEPAGLVDLDPEHGAEQGIGWISLLYLAERFRNRGFGIQLLARAIFFYEDLNRHRLRLQVAENNGIARAFYVREGFRCVGEQITHGGKLLIMERA